MVTMQEEQYEYKSSRHAKYLCNYHFVWIPKYRRKIITPEIKEELKSYIRSIGIENGFEVITMEAETDHIHLFISTIPSNSPAHLANVIKGSTSRFLGKKYPKLKTHDGEIWTKSYFVCTAGNVSSKTIQAYIEGKDAEG